MDQRSNFYVAKLDVDKLNLIVKLEEFIEKLEAMVSQLEKRFNEGFLNNEEYLEKKEILNNKLMEAKAHLEKLKK